MFSSFEVTYPQITAVSLKVIHSGARKAKRVNDKTEVLLPASFAVNVACRYRMTLQRCNLSLNSSLI